ncbi:hypothetical protein C8J57DRAFT_1594533 [Mycena rebaudengoi]|nr:hypothetical protein C8J57DRAFT_1594533 [Mycena rebaudengoi]
MSRITPLLQVPNVHRKVAPAPVRAHPTSHAAVTIRLYPLRSPAFSVPASNLVPHNPTRHDVMLISPLPPPPPPPSQLTPSTSSHGLLSVPRPGPPTHHASLNTPLNRLGPHFVFHSTKDLAAYYGILRLCPRSLMSSNNDNDRTHTLRAIDELLASPEFHSLGHSFPFAADNTDNRNTSTSPEFPHTSPLFDALDADGSPLSDAHNVSPPLFDDATSPLCDDAASPIFDFDASPLFADSNSSFDSASPLFTASNKLFADLASPLENSPLSDFLPRRICLRSMM